MPNVSLTPELEAFAARCVQTGRYANVSEVHRAALRLLQQVERERQDFIAMLEAAQAESAEQGFVSADEVFADLDGIIARRGAAQ